MHHIPEFNYGMMQRIFIGAAMAVLVLFSLATGCVDEESSKKALESQGFTDIKFTGNEWPACGDRDFFHTGFRAKNSKKEDVQGVVCCGLFAKRCTIRW